MFFIQQIGKPTSPLSFAKCSRKDLPFFLLFPFSSIQSKHFCEQIDLVVCFISFLFSEKIFTPQKKTLMKNILFFSSITFCYCSSRFALTIVFRFRFCLIFCFLDLLLQLIFPVLHFQFSLTTISPSSCIKKTFQIFHYTCMGYLLMSFLLTHFSKSKKNLFVHFPFCWALFHIYLFLHVLSFFFRFSFFFYPRVFKHVSSLFSFLNVVCSLLVPFSVYLFKKICLV